MEVPNATFLDMPRTVEEQVSRLRGATLREIADDRGETAR